MPFRSIILQMNRQQQIWDDWDVQEQADAMARWKDNHRQNRRRMRRVVVYRMNPFTAMSETEFVDRFRLTKDSAHSLIQEITEHLPTTYDMRGKKKF